MSQKRVARTRVAAEEAKQKIIYCEKGIKRRHTHNFIRIFAKKNIHMCVRPMRVMHRNTKRRQQQRQRAKESDDDEIFFLSSPTRKKNENGKKCKYYTAGNFFLLADLNSTAMENERVRCESQIREGDGFFFCIKV